MRLTGILLASVLLCDGAAAQTSSEFEAWKRNFIERSLSEGHSESMLFGLLAEVTLDPDIVALTRRQSDFAPPLWSYLETRVSPGRIARGQEHLEQQAPLLGSIEQTYGVPAEILISVWAMESRFGEASLTYDPRRSLATLASLGRRQRYYEQELLALGALMEHGELTQPLTSSWDGGLGQPQFMPSNFLAYAVDGDADGQRDLWTNSADVLASIAHYLHQHGWRTGEPLLVEANAPAALTSSERVFRSLREWRALGVEWRGDFPEDFGARLVRLDGANGHTLLVFNNFDVLYRYNGAQKYGLAAALLAGVIADRPLLESPWPRPADAVDQEGLRATQRALAALGYNIGEPDGVYGERTWIALNAFAQDRGMPPVSYANHELLGVLLEAADEASEDTTE